VSAGLHIEVSDLADQQIREAEPWWRRNRDKALNAIREELARIGHLIAYHPRVGALARNTALPGVRKIHIERIHYDVYYRLTGSPEYIEIVAFWGSRRGAGPPI
jgi:plasmid stabilization system protein ParE